MKTINALYWINKVFLGSTLLLYITIYFGLLAQLALGVIQLLSSLLLLFDWKNIWEHHKKLVYYYWLIVLIYFIGTWGLTLFKNANQVELLFGIIILPMSIAIYFTHILYRLNRNFQKNRSNQQALT